MEDIKVANMSGIIGKPKYVLVRENEFINSKFPNTLSIVEGNKKNVYVPVYCTGKANIGRISKKHIPLLREEELVAVEIEL